MDKTKDFHSVQTQNLQFAASTCLISLNSLSKSTLHKFISTSVKPPINNSSAGSSINWKFQQKFCYSLMFIIKVQDWHEQHRSYIKLWMSLFILLFKYDYNRNKKHLKMLGPFATASHLTSIHQVLLAVLSHAACASMSTTTTTTTTTTRDRGDRYGPMEWAQ